MLDSAETSGQPSRRSDIVSAALAASQQTAAITPARATTGDGPLCLTAPGYGAVISPPNTTTWRRPERYRYLSLRFVRLARGQSEQLELCQHRDDRRVLVRSRAKRLVQSIRRRATIASSMAICKPMPTGDANASPSTSPRLLSASAAPLA